MAEWVQVLEACMRGNNVLKTALRNRGAHCVRGLWLLALGRWDLAVRPGGLLEPWRVAEVPLLLHPPPSTLTNAVSPVPSLTLGVLWGGADLSRWAGKNGAAAREKEKGAV